MACGDPDMTGWGWSDAVGWYWIGVDRGNAIIKAQREMREADSRPSEVIVREMRDEWED